MTKTKAAAATVSKKSGATKRGNLSVVEGGKGAPAGGLVLADKKTPPNREAMINALGVLKAIGPGGAEKLAKESDAEILARVRARLAPEIKKTKEDDLIRCPTCEEIATDATDVCPFCGSEGEDAPEALATAATVVASKSTATAAPTKSTPPVASTGDALVAAEAELSEIMATIATLQSDVARNSYDLGVHITTIHNKELWKARGHASFKEFIEKDLGISRPLAYRMMDVVKEYDRDTFAKVGATKLALISDIKDDEERAAALDAARAGATTTDIRGRQAAAREPGSRGSTTREASGDSTPVPKKSGEITLLAKVGGKAVQHGFRSATSGRPIASWKEDAYVEIELSDDVRQRIALKHDKEGNIIAVTVAFVRVE